MEYGFLKVASAIPHVGIANCAYNRQQIERLILQACKENVAIICFPELSLTGYTCQDLFEQQKILDDAEEQLDLLRRNTQDLNIISIIGLPIRYQGLLLNCAAVISCGKIIGIVPKSYLPNYKEFYEMRWFSSARNIPTGYVYIANQEVPIGRNILFHTGQCIWGIEICEDVWAPIPPSSELSLKGAEVIFNLSADNDSIGKYRYLKNLIAQQSARAICGYVFSGCGFGESTQDVVFSGKGFIFENGQLLSEAERFSLKEQLIINDIDIERLQAERRINTTFSTSILEHITTCPPLVIDAPVKIEKGTQLHRTFEAHPFVPTGSYLNERCEEIFNIQVQGLAKRLAHTHCQKVVIGISGGLDSTLALLVCVKTFSLLNYDKRGIIGITMPGFGTTSRTHSNATSLMEELGITTREISIIDAVKQHFKDLDIDSSIHDVTYENSQARERTQILMDAANQVGGMVIGTGDLSELALGWATYNGDHMSMYGVNCSVPKTLVRHLVTWIAQQMNNERCKAVLLDIVNTPISPELIPADDSGNIQQKTEDLVGPYELHDFFLYQYLRFGSRPSKIYFLAKNAFATTYSDEIIKKWLTVFCKRFFAQQFKRSCLPDGPKVGSCSLSPRGDWRMPSDADSQMWLEECNNL